ncbi:MAG: hypothetical protein Q9213_002749 [Squamulea squamosa]
MEQEHFDQGSTKDLTYQNRWPQEHILPGFREFMESWYEKMAEIAGHLMEALEHAFVLPPGAFLGRMTHEKNASEARLLHYPKIDMADINKGGVSRIWPHFDLGVITLLFQDGVGGLECEDRESRGNFISVGSDSRSEMVVNVSETLQRWTNGSVQAGLHRVTVPKTFEGRDSGMVPERYSVTYFCKADRDASVGALPHVGGSALGSVLLSHHVFLLNGLGVVCSIIALAANTFLPPQLGQSNSVSNTLDITATELLLNDETEPQLASSVQPVGPWQGGESMSGIVLGSWRSSLHSVMTLFQVPRPTFTVIWIFLLYSFTTRVEVLNPQYISLTLGWSLATVNVLLAGKALLSAVILFALPTIRKLYLEPKMNDQQIDLLVVKASLLLNAVGTAGFGISISSPLFIIALLVYTSGNGLYDSLTTFGLTSLTGEQEPADFLVRSSLVQTLAGLVAAPFWSSLFSLCLKSNKLPTGLSYWVSAGLFGGTIGLARSLHGQGTHSPLNWTE